MTGAASPDDPSDTELLRYLDDDLPPARLSELEAELRASETLRERLSRLIDQHDAGEHSVGAIWRRERLSCPTRSQLGGYLLGTLDDEFHRFVKRHLELLGCRVCRANLEDLQTTTHGDAEPTRRRTRYFESSIGSLKSDDDG